MANVLIERPLEALESEEHAVLLWRCEQFRELGFDPVDAQLLAASSADLGHAPNAARRHRRLPDRDARRRARARPVDLPPLDELPLRGRARARARDRGPGREAACTRGVHPPDPAGALGGGAPAYQPGAEGDD